MNIEDLRMSARSATVREGKVAKTDSCFFGRPAARALAGYIQERQSGTLFQTDHRVQKGGVSRDRYGVWRGYWRERDEGGKLRMESARLGDYELPSKERAQIVAFATLPVLE